MGAVDEGWRRVADGLERCVREVRAREAERNEAVREKEMEREGVKEYEEGKGLVRVRRVGRVRKVLHMVEDRLQPARYHTPRNSLRL